MSVNLYQTGVSGLLAAQQQLATTGHNISNVNTEGYNRQRAEQNTAVGLYNGGNFIGSGTYIQDITRIYNQFTYKEQLQNQTNLGNANSNLDQLSQLNDIMSFSGQAVMNSITNFYQAVNGIADNPSDLGLRSIALSQANILSSDFRSLSENFDQIEKSTNGEIEQIAAHISDISVELAKINEQILFSADLSENGAPNDLLDSRDKLVTELGKYVSVNTVTDSNNVMTVMIGRGSTLVTGITPLTLSVEAGDPDPMQTELTLVGPTSSVSLLGNTVGGELASKFEFRDKDLKQVRTEINRLAMAISETLNASQHDGLDLNAQEGKDFFTDINTLQLQQGRVLSHSDNTGSVVGQANITDLSLIPTDEFEVVWDGANYQMTNLTDNSPVTLTLVSPGVYDTGLGFEFIVTGAPVANDKFTVRPTENSAALMQVTLADGAGIAASEAVEVKASENNIGGGSVDITNMKDPKAFQLVTPVRWEILEDPIGTFTVTNFNNLGVPTGSFPYTPPSQTYSYASVDITISGTPSGIAPSAPEVFEFVDAFGIGNGNNAVKMALTQEEGVLNGGRETFSQSLAVSTSDVGSKASSAELVANTAEALFTQAFNRNQSTSGVNLDEEAANLLKFQQAYQASSQIISVANTIFDTLLAAAR